MPLRHHLSAFERGQIVAYHGEGLSATDIGKKLGRDRSTISKFLKNPAFDGPKKRPGRPRVLKKRAIRRILRAAASGTQSANQIRLSQRVPLTTRSVQNIISTSGHLRYEKRKQKPKLEKKHIEARLSWGERMVSTAMNWKNVLFSDEKKFNLDGPDGNQYYWHDLRHEPQHFSKRVQGGGSVMVWAAFGLNGRTPIVFLRGPQTALCYQEVLRQHLLPHGRRIGGRLWMFQQDNASIHSANSTKDWLQKHKVRLLEWPSRSPDLNPIENLWGSLVRLVYSNGRQYNSVGELEEAIQAAWEVISEDELHRLVNSMPKRCIELLKTNGNSIRY
jgi:transposase